METHYKTIKQWTPTGAGPMVPEEDTFLGPPLIRLAADG